jgi:hypothetical protein
VKPGVLRNKREREFSIVKGFVRGVLAIIEGEVIAALKIALYVQH